MRNIDASKLLGNFLSDQHFLGFFSRPQSLKNEPKVERQPKATQPCPTAEETREDGKRDEGEMAAERGKRKRERALFSAGRAPAEDVVAALRHH